MNLHVVEEITLKITIKRINENSIYIRSLYVQTKIMIKIKKQKTQFNNCNFLIPDVPVANQPKLFTFEIKDVFSLDVFKVDLVLKIKDNLCLFVLS